MREGLTISAIFAGDSIFVMRTGNDFAVKVADEVYEIDASVLQETTALVDAAFLNAEKQAQEKKAAALQEAIEKLGATLAALLVRDELFPVTYPIRPNSAGHVVDPDLASQLIKYKDRIVKKGGDHGRSNSL